MSERYAMLEFVSFAGRASDGHRLARFRCDCGSEKVIPYSRVKNGYTRSCGCLIALSNSNLRHGYRGTPTYSSWRSAKYRTTNPRSKDYPRYGGAGIGFCERWMDFENFLSDMGERPAGTSLDRIDGSKGYEPGNCRWANVYEQARNTKHFTLINTPSGIMPIIDYAKQIGISNGAAHLRLRRGKLEGCSYATKNN